MARIDRAALLPGTLLLLLLLDLLLALLGLFGLRADPRA